MTERLHPAKAAIAVAWWVLIFNGCDGGEGAPSAAETPPRALEEDQICVVGALASDPSAVVVDGAWENSSDARRILRIHGCGDAGNLIPSATPKIVAFSPGRRPALDTSVSWTEGFETRSVTLHEQLQAQKIALYFADPPEVEEAIGIAVKLLATALANHWAGVEISALFIGDVSSEASQIGTDCDSAINMNATLFDASAINVYYVDHVGYPAVSGKRCQNMPNVIYIDTDYDKVHLLAHEVGHAFGLEHLTANGYIMNEAGCGLSSLIDPATGELKCDPIVDEECDLNCSVNDKFTLGEVFRINFDSDSLVSATPPLHCLPSDPNDDCPDQEAPFP